MQTLNERIGAVIRGQHCMGTDGLRDYHAIQDVKHAKLCRDYFRRLLAIKRALKNYNVMVSGTPDDSAIRVYCPTTGAEVLL